MEINGVELPALFIPGEGRLYLLLFIDITQVASEGAMSRIGAALKMKVEEPLALELLGREISMFIERHEVGGAGDFARMSDDELRRVALLALGHAPEGGKPN